VPLAGALGLVDEPMSALQAAIRPTLSQDEPFDKGAADPLNFSAAALRAAMRALGF
jgi:hypothetical protein